MRSVRKAILFSFLVVIAVTFLALSLAKAEQAKYVGVAKCKMCHSIQYKSWQNSKHAQAMSALTGEDATNPKCLECHNTGYDKEQAEGADLANVQCEACHGAGSEYKSMEVMKDKAKAEAAGLITPNEETCKNCHNERNPFNKPFDYEERLKAGAHEHKS